jgi:hypothetical protein
MKYYIIIKRNIPVMAVLFKISRSSGDNSVNQPFNNVSMMIFELKIEEEWKKRETKSRA